MKYIVFKESRNGNGDVINEEFDIKEKAVDCAENWGTHLTNGELKKERVFVIESVNPDEDAENHFDGDIVYEYSRDDN